MNLSPSFLDENKQLNFSARHFLVYVALLSVCWQTGCATSQSIPLSGWWKGSSSGNNLASKLQEPKVPFTKDGKVKNPGLLHLKYARWQEELGNIVEARQSYEQALTSNPRSQEALIGLARVNQLAGRTREAERGYTKALQLDPNNPQSLDAIGQFYAAEKRWDEAVDVLNKAMLAAPDETLYRFHLAVAMTKQGNISGALPHFKHTVGEAEGHYNIGQILANDGKLKQAEKQFLLALDQKPNLTEAQTMLEQVRHGMNEDVIVVSAEIPSSSMQTIQQQQRQNQRASSFLNGYQRGTQLSAPTVPQQRLAKHAEAVHFSGNQMGHSSDPAEFQTVRTGVQTAYGVPSRTNSRTLSAIQREQRQNQQGKQ